MTCAINSLRKNFLCRAVMYSRFSVEVYAKSLSDPLIEMWSRLRISKRKSQRQDMFSKFFPLIRETCFAMAVLCLASFHSWISKRKNLNIYSASRRAEGARDDRKNLETISKIKDFWIFYDNYSFQKKHKEICN